MGNDIQNKDKKALPLFFFAVIFAVIGIVVQGMAVVFGYDTVMQVYKSGSAIGTVAAVVLFAEVAAFAVLAIVLLEKSGRLTSIPSSTDSSSFISAATGCVIIVSSFFMFFEAIRFVGAAKNVTVAMAILSIPAGLYFILSSSKSKNDQMLSYLGFFPVIWIAACLLRIYFDVGAAINDPIRILFQISFISIMLALLFELKVRVGKNGTLPLVIFSGISIILGLASVLSMVILFIIPKTVTTGEVLLSASQLLICLYLLTSLYSEVSEI